MEDELCGRVLDTTSIRLEEVIGAGAMGKVYRGHQEEAQRDVAVKVLCPRGGEDALLAARRFRDEARAASRLSHPDLVAILDVGDDSLAGPFIVFEYLSGHDLRTTIGKEGALGWPATFERVATPLLNGLHALHGIGILHRDVKPENIIAGADGHFKLGDFGLAVFEGRDARTKTGSFIGTLRYMAPERFGDDRDDVGVACDLYAAALVIVEAATGTLPHAATSPLDFVGAAGGRPVSASELQSQGLSAAVATLLAQTLAPNPEERPSSALELYQALAATTSTTPAREATTRYAVEPPPQARVRPPSIARCLLGLLGVLVAALVFFLISHSRQQSPVPLPTSARLAAPALERAFEKSCFALAGRKALPATVEAEALAQSARELGLLGNIGLPPDVGDEYAGLYYLARRSASRKDNALALRFCLCLLDRSGPFHRTSVEHSPLAEAVAWAQGTGRTDELTTRLEGWLTEEETPILRTQLRLYLARLLLHAYGQTIRLTQKRLPTSKSGPSPLTRARTVVEETLAQEGLTGALHEEALTLYVSVLGFLGKRQHRQTLFRTVGPFFHPTATEDLPSTAFTMHAAEVVAYSFDGTSQSHLAEACAWLQRVARRPPAGDERALILNRWAALLLRSGGEFKTTQCTWNQTRANDALRLANTASSMARTKAVGALAETTKAWALAACGRLDEARRVLRTIRADTLTPGSRWWYYRVEAGVACLGKMYRTGLTSLEKSFEVVPPNIRAYLFLLHLRYQYEATATDVPALHHVIDIQHTIDASKE